MLHVVGFCVVTYRERESCGNPLVKTHVIMFARNDWLRDVIVFMAIEDCDSKTCTFCQIHLQLSLLVRSVFALKRTKQCLYTVLAF